MTKEYLFFKSYWQNAMNMNMINDYDNTQADGLSLKDCWLRYAEDNVNTIDIGDYFADPKEINKIIHQKIINSLSKETVRSLLRYTVPTNSYKHNNINKITKVTLKG